MRKIIFAVIAAVMCCAVICNAETAYIKISPCPVSEGFVVDAYVNNWEQTNKSNVVRSICVNKNKDKIIGVWVTYRPCLDKSETVAKSSATIARDIVPCQKTTTTIVVQPVQESVTIVLEPVQPPVRIVVQPPVRRMMFPENGIWINPDQYRQRIECDHVPVSHQQVYMNGLWIY